MPTTRALRKAADGATGQQAGVVPKGIDESRLGEDLLYATTVCSQLTHTPLKLRSTPPSLSLYLDAAIVGG